MSPRLYLAATALAGVTAFAAAPETDPDGRSRSSRATGWSCGGCQGALRRLGGSAIVLAVISPTQSEVADVTREEHARSEKGNDLLAGFSE